MSKISVELLDSMGSDLSCVNAARVSFAKHSKGLGSTGTDGDMRPILHYSDEKLIKYLAKHKHFSPFGHCFASFRISCPIFVSRQLVKHSYLRINEVSRRYVKSQPDIFYPDWWRQSVKDKKQGSGDRLEDDTANKVIASTLSQCNKAVAHYNYLLELGVCEEQARMVLPANLMTQFWWSGSLDAFARMAVLRCSPDTQQETRSVANLVSHEMSRLYPISWASLTTTSVLGEYDAKRI